MKYTLKKVLCLVACLAILALLAPGCGSKGSKASGDGDEPGGGDTPTPPAPSFNFTGLVFSGNGEVPRVDIRAIRDAEDSDTTLTNASGQFSLNIPEERHTVLGSKSGYVDTFRLADLSSGAAVEQTMMMAPARASVVPVLAQSGGAVVSNAIDQRTARLEIAPQSGGTFGNGTSPRTASMDFSVEYVDLERPLPAPMPSPETLAEEDLIIGGKQAPAAMIVVKPALMKMETPGTLAIPNPAGLANVRILRFDPYVHRWVEAGGTEPVPGESTSISISEGGVYGIFYEEIRLGAVRGTASPGSIVYVGDEVLRVSADGTFYAGNVPIPPGGALDVVGVELDEEGNFLGAVSQRIALQSGETEQVDLVQTAIGSVSVTSENETLFADPQYSTTISAAVTDENGNTARDGTQVTFSTTAGSLSGDTSGGGGTVIAVTQNGTARVTLTAPSATGVATVRAEAGGQSDETDITFVPVPETFSLSLSQNAVLSDDSDETTITATVLDSNNVPISGVPVTFSSDGGSLSAASAVTNEEGEAEITFSAGPIRKNQVVTVTASIGDGLEESIPVRIEGTTISLSTDQTNLEIGADAESLLTVTLRDAGGKAIFGADVDFSVEPEGSLRWTPAQGYTDFVTDVNGTLRANVIGSSVAEEARLIVQSLGATSEQVYSVSSTGEAFRITEPVEDPASMVTSGELTIRVNAPAQESVKFSTTFGRWKSNQKQVLDVPVSDNTASAVLVSNEAGIATVQASDGNDLSVFDLLKVAISAPSSEASRISLQAGSTIVSPSTDAANPNTVELTATVTNDADQVVAGAPIRFHLENTTGGGESISPSLALTNNLGKVEATFESGSLSSDADGVKVIASLVDDETVSEQLAIVIGGSPVSIAIGQGSVRQSEADENLYELPLSVLVADANGNPVSGANVSLNAWPSVFATGIWSGCVNGSGCCITRTMEIPNEDQNRNLVLDPDEDDVNGDNKPTPPRAAAGLITEGTNETDDTGIARFTLVYPKDSAGWIKDEITATSSGAGSKAQAKLSFWLPWVGSDSQTCSLPDSPYNIDTPPGEIIVTSSSNLLPADGESTSTIEAIVLDTNGNIMPDETPVEFTIAGPTANDPTWGGFPIATNTTVGTERGIATVTYRAGTTPTEEGSPVVITATVRGQTGDTVPSVEIILIEPTEDQVATIGVTVDPTSIRADGQSSALITATVQNINGEPISQGTPVTFSFVPSDIGATFPNGMSTYTVTTTDETGIVNVPLTSGRVPGDVEVVVESGGITSTAALEFKGMPVGESFTIRSDNLNITELETALISVSASDIIGKPVPDGTLVFFKTYSTGGKLTPSSDPTVNGEASSVLNPIEGVPPANGVISVTAETTGGPSTHVTSLALAPEDPNAMDNYILFAGTSGGGVYKSTDSGATWTNVSRSTVERGQNYIQPYVNDVSVDWDDPDTVYAATGFGPSGNIYRSLDGGLNWDSNEPEGWTGLLPLDKPVTVVISDFYTDADPGTASPWVWAGTEGKGVYYSEDGERFIQGQGLSTGAFVTDLERVKDVDHHGADAVLYAGTPNGLWMSGNGGQNWEKKSTFTGDSINAIEIFPERGVIGTSDIIYAGTEDAGVWMSLDSGDSWTAFPQEGMTERTILDLLVDGQNNYLYALAYEWDESDPIATGNIYAHELTIQGDIGQSAWVKVNRNLPDNPPDPTNTLAQYAIAGQPNSMGNLTALYVGGEGINLFKATDGLATGNPNWQESDEGLSNTIMARMPIVVRDLDTMTMSFANDPPGYIQNGDQAGFVVFIEDENGNPPASGASWVVTFNGSEILNYTFSDSRKHPVLPIWGAHPYSNTLQIAPGDQIRFEFTDSEGSLQWRVFTF